MTQIDQETRERFCVRFTNSEEEVKAVLELRKLCFHRDFIMNDFERNASHLIVVDSDFDKIVGAYRLTSTLQSNNFESEEDFHLKEWLKTSGVKLELSWACTHPDYRQGAVIALLWRGLAEYIKTQKVKYLFGPASLMNTSSDQMQQILHYLKSNHYELNQNDIYVRLEKRWQEPNLDFIDKQKEKRTLSKRLLPALLRAYLLAGALVLLQPALDQTTDCYDLITILDVDNCDFHVRNHFDI